MWIGYFKAMAESHPHLETTLPVLTFTDTLSLHSPERAARLISVDRSYTGSDLVLHLPDDGILFPGDIVFNGMHPWLPDGYPERWATALQSLSNLEIGHMS